MDFIFKVLRYIRYFCLAFYKGYFTIKKMYPTYSVWKSIKSSYRITRLFAYIYWISTPEEWNLMYETVAEGLDK